MLEWVEALTQLLLALGVVFNGWQSFRNGRKIETVRHATNSIKDELVVAVRGEAMALGRAEGRAQVTDEQHH